MGLEKSLTVRKYISTKIYSRKQYLPEKYYCLKNDELL